MVRRFFLSTFWLLFGLARPYGAEATDRVFLSGRVIERGTERPLEGIPIGVVRGAAVRERTPKRGAIPEWTALTDREGRYTLSVPADTAGLVKVLVFTCAEDRINLVYPEARFDTRWPVPKAVRRKKVTFLDLTRDLTDINFSLPPPTTYGRNVMVPMRDGTRLATDIYLPPGEGPWPVILFRTPYGKSGDPPTRLLERGYAVVRQDFRGRFDSEGENDMPFLPDGWGEQQDGYDAIDWVAGEPWCNGKVGTMGGSAGGITQVMTAGAGPPHLVCQTIGVAFGSMYHHAVYPGGAFRKALVEGWLRENNFSRRCLETAVAHPRYDDYWRMLDASTRSADVTVPGLFIGGWYDVFCQGSTDAFMWRQYEGGEGARGKQRLIMGPWVHGRGPKLGEFELPEHALRSPLEKREGGWFAYWLKGEENGVMDTPAAHYYVMGAFGEPGAPGHEWRTSDTWPVPSQPMPFYLRADGTLASGAPDLNGATRAYQYDPENPVPTRGGCNLILDRGPMDQRPVENRPDVLLYTSEPLAEAMEVTGRIKALLWASSSCTDTDFTVKLTDVYPDGRSMLVQDGILRARFRNSFEHEALLKPGEIYRFEVDLWSTSIVFNAGHRIRVAVSSSNAPRFDPNPNTGDPFHANDRTVVATNTICHDAEHPSHVLLPVVPVE